MALTVSDGFPYYISLTENASVKDLVNEKDGDRLFVSITEDKSIYRYAQGKWSIKQILGHIVDHERIMMYRTLRFSRNDKTQLPGYDQELLVNNSYFDRLPYSQLLEDYRIVRQNTLSFFNMLQPEQMNLTGLAWKFDLTVEQMFRATIGHEHHHIKILKERYL